jgi:hypothetical protein
MREQFSKALSAPLLSVVNPPWIMMNSEYITIVCCVGSGQGDLGFAVNVPRNQTTGWLKGTIRDKIKVPESASLGNVSLYKVCSGSVDCCG